jgi:hypothetical protein
MKRSLRLRRRDFLQSIGAGFGFTALGSHSQKITPYQTPPPDKTPVELGLYDTAPSVVRTDDWIAFQFSLVTEGNEGRRELEKVRSSADYSFQLNDVEVADLHRGWLQTEMTPYGRHEQGWRYIISPMSPGRHTYTLKITFPESVTTAGNPDRVWEGTYQFENDYTVRPEQLQRTMARHRRRLFKQDHRDNVEEQLSQTATTGEESHHD